MRKEASIGSYCLRFGVPSHIPYNFALGRGANLAMVRKVHPPEEINTGGVGLDGYLVRMQHESEAVLQECFQLREKIHEKVSVFGKNDEVVGVADIMTYTKFLLHIAIKFVHIDIHQELRGQIPERQPLPRCNALEARDYDMKKHAHFHILDMKFEQALEYGVIDVCEEFAYVALKHVAGARVVSRYLPSKQVEPIHGAMRALLLPARVGIVYESTFEIWIQRLIQKVVHQTITYGRFMYVAGLWI